MDDAWLTIDSTDDIARLSDGPALLDDAGLDGRKWNIGLERFAERLGRPWTMTILPLRGDAQIYLDGPPRPDIAGAQMAAIRSVRIEAEYKLTITPAKTGS